MIIIVPMAGRGKRYADKGYGTPKPLVEIFDKPMFDWALRSLEGVEFDLVIFVALREHEQQFHITNYLNNNFDSPFKVHLLDEVTEGQLATVLAAKEYYQEDTDILIISSDTWVVSDIGTHIKEKDHTTAGLISVLQMEGDQWSFVKADEEGIALEVAEKVRISDQASTGLYYFSSSADFIRYAESMIANEERTKGEFYVIPVYQKMIADSKVIRTSQALKMWDFGTPESKDRFTREY